MPNNIHITCDTIPTAEAGPLILRMEPEVGILSLHIGALGPCPKGINIDGMIMFDMQNDGGVDQIEIMYRLRNSIKSGTVFPSPHERYRRLRLSSDTSHFIGGVEVTEGTQGIEFRFAEGQADETCFVGPCTKALIYKRRLIGLSLDYSNISLARPRIAI